MELNLKNYLSKFAALILILFTVHFLLYRALTDFLAVSLNQLFEIYVFLIVLNLAHFYSLRWLFKKWAKYAGLLFTGLSMFKMGIAIVFLVPYIFPQTPQSIPIVLNFMVIYFVTLTFEVIIVAKSVAKN